MRTSKLGAPMGELKCANDLLDDREALAAAWERDGYWFFRDVLDKEVIGRIRQTYTDYLLEMGVARMEGPSPRYNGADVSGLHLHTALTRLNDAKVHKILHEAPTINAFFAKLFGCDPFWIPFTMHRTNPPVSDRSTSRFDLIHEDGVYNDGLPFLICWVPVDDIDEDTGGVALLEGVHKGPCLHRREGTNILPIDEQDVPSGQWRRTDYKPGDVLMMGLHTPHSGLSNISADRFRMSLDTRIMPSTGKVPLVGTLTEVTKTGLKVEDANGVHELAFDSTSFVRGHQGDRMPLHEIPDRYKPGKEVIIAFEDRRVVNMRPQN
ncbi:phytanoyl-CoA dioxygenase [Ramlibacter sp. WS9]|nr:phytanoyl-CoA dioxygenase [Ramlibacter sp. WS9]